ncbi:MAG: hypothetical protein ACOCWQ_02385 [Nanoarchaeota archaeon]
MNEIIRLARVDGEQRYPMAEIRSYSGVIADRQQKISQYLSWQSRPMCRFLQNAYHCVRKAVGAEVPDLSLLLRSQLEDIRTLGTAAGSLQNKIEEELRDTRDRIDGKNDAQQRQQKERKVCLHNINGHMQKSAKATVLGSRNLRGAIYRYATTRQKQQNTQQQIQYLESLEQMLEGVYFALGNVCVRTAFMVDTLQSTLRAYEVVQDAAEMIGLLSGMNSALQVQLRQLGGGFEQGYAQALDAYRMLDSPQEGPQLPRRSELVRQIIKDIEHEPS